MWINVGVQVDGRTDLAHVAMFDHPDNIGYPQAWRVDGEFGVGAARSRAAHWAIKKGQTEIIRHRLVASTGTLDDVKLTDLWSAYTGNRSTYATQALWGLAQREGRLERFLKPDEAAAAMTALAGYTVNAWAGEPMGNSRWRSAGTTAAGSGWRRTSTTKREDAASPTPGRVASRFSRIPIVTASRTAARFSWKGSSFRPHLPLVWTVSSSVPRRTCSSSRTATVTTGPTWLISRCASQAGGFKTGTKSSTVFTGDRTDGSTACKASPRHQRSESQLGRAG